MINCASDINARLAFEFHRSAQDLISLLKTCPAAIRSLWQAQEEIAMSHPLRWRSRHTASAAFMLALMTAPAALASQGPGGGPGTASPLTQTVMAIVVYGGVALILAAGLVGSLRRRF